MNPWEFIAAGIVMTFLGITANFLALKNLTPRGLLRNHLYFVLLGLISFMIMSSGALSIALGCRYLLK